MKLRSLWCALIALMLGTGPVLAWDAEGHEVVGAIADQLLGTNANQQVAKILGFKLAEAATWADCVRSVHRHKDGTFEYVHDQHFGVPCVGFETDDEKDRMEDYVSRNWSNCRYEDKPTNCHKAFHFTDVAIQHDDYQRSFVGTNDHDVVSAINAAIAVLKGGSAPPPFSIKDQKEALFLLAHFVGDIHQPLHVGAVYLDADGHRVNPDAGTFDPTTETAGGNSIHEAHGSLHTDWDDVPSSLRHGGLADLVAAARTQPTTSGPVEGWAAKWASDTILKAHEAFTGVTFSRVTVTAGGKRKWDALFADETDYDDREADLKHEQLAKGGARLAQLLNTIWP
jgi:S1/P1 Nuclease